MSDEAARTETGEVVSVNVSAEKGTIKRPAPYIRLYEHGVADDAHAGAWHRQVSLLSEEVIREFEREAGRRIAPGEFAENITTRGLSLRNMCPLDRIAANQAELEVTQIGKECHGETCAIFREVGRCVMPKEGIFCRVVTGGRIAPGDRIAFRPRPLRVTILTVSDRASRGDYADRSGPRLRERLEGFFSGKRWHPQIETRVLPDEARRLETELRAACDGGADVVFTTGGTGVGPRDVTPDVVAALADRTIPGIMEHIRVKYGQSNPKALLSRGVAAVLGRTLVYTLPGSVRAVGEYVEEILATLEHTVLMLHGVDAHGSSG